MLIEIKDQIYSPILILEVCYIIVYQKVREKKRPILINIEFD